MANNTTPIPFNNLPWGHQENISLTTFLTNDLYPRPRNERIVIVKILFRLITILIDSNQRAGRFHLDLRPEVLILRINEEHQNQSIFVQDGGRIQNIPDGIELIQTPGVGGLDEGTYLAPEMVDLSPDIYWRKVNVWKLGITLYHMLFQDFPFWCNAGQTNIYCPIFQAICERGEIEFFLNENNINFSPVYDLLQNMLRRDPVERYSIEQVLNHNWLLGEGE